VCPGEPDKVTDLRAVAAWDIVDLTWTPRRGDLVEIRAPDRTVAPPPGIVSVDQAKAATRLVAASRSGRTRVTADDLAGQQTLVPVTVSGALAAIGPAVVIDIPLEPVTELRAVRFGPQVRLLWHWPMWAREVLVVWRHGAPPTGPTDPAASRLRTSRTSYLSRGVWVHADRPGAYWFGVCVTDRDRFGPFVTVESPCPVQARYRVHKRAWARGRARTVTVEGDVALPDVAVVAQTGRRPMAPEDGVMLVVLPGGGPTSQTEFAVPATLPRPVHLRAFALDGSVWLRHPDPRDLVVP
jgi:hypothetical protein